LYYFEPVAKGFKDIPSGQTLECTYRSRKWLAGRSDNFPNWYVTAPGMTSKVIKSTAGESLGFVGPFDSPEKWKRAKEDKYNPYTLYERFDLLKRSPSKERPFKIVPTPKNFTVNFENTMQLDLVNWVVNGSQDFEHECQWLAGKFVVYILSKSHKQKF